MRECEEVWIRRNQPGLYSLGTGEYGKDETDAKLKDQTRNKMQQIQGKP